MKFYRSNMFSGCLSKLQLALLVIGFLAQGHPAKAYVGGGSNTVLLWHLNEGDGTNAYDQSSNGLHGTLGTAASGANPAWVGITAANAGRYGNALDFETTGTDDYVEVNDNNALDITGSITLEAWIRPETTGNTNRVIMAKWNTTGNQRSYIFRQPASDGNDLEFCVSSDGTAANTTCIVDTANPLTAGTLYHVAAVKDGTAMEIYVNGVRTATGTGPASIFSSTANFTLGCDLNGTTRGNGFDGTIDEVRVLSAARDEFNPGVVINSVTHSPTSGNEQWTLYNGSGNTIDLETWEFQQCSTTNNYVVPTAGTHNMTAGSTVTIVVGSGTDGTPANTYYTANGTGANDISSLAASDCLRSYPTVNTTTTTATDLIDFVAWGADAAAGDDDAVTAGQWDSATYVSTVPTVNQQTITLFITENTSLIRAADNEEGVIDWIRHADIDLQGEPRTPAQGDLYTANNGGGRNIPYRFFIEVPDSTRPLWVEIFDADVGRGGFNEADYQRDRDQDETDFDTDTVYRLINPSGTTVATYTGDETNGMDNAFMTPNGFRVASPAAGRWTLEADGTVGTNGDDINKYIPRSPGFQMYTRYIHFGSNFLSGTLRPNLFFPWNNSGCSMNVYEWDSDANNAGTQTQIDVRQIYGSNATTYTQTVLDAAMSGNSAWGAHSFTGYSNLQEQTNYGPYEVIFGLDGYTGSANYAILEMRNNLGGGTGDAGDADTDANVIDMYLPKDDGGPPLLPFIVQYFRYRNGPNPLVTSATTQLRVGVSIINTTGRAINNVIITAAVPSSGGQVTYQGLYSITHGSLTAQPGIGGTGTITWNVGNIAANSSGADLTYLVNVTPSSASNVVLTGIPAGAPNGTSASIDLPGRATSTNSNGTTALSPICQLEVPVSASVSTYISLQNFAATPYQDAVLLEWDTGSEIDNLGFNVYRSESPEGPFAQINSSVILGLLTNPQGGQYYFIDDEVLAGRTYYYVLEDIDLSTLATRHGPVQAHVSTTLASFAQSGFSPVGYTNGGQSSAQNGNQNSTPGNIPNGGKVSVEEQTDGLLVSLEFNPLVLKDVTQNQTIFSQASINGFSAVGEACHPHRLERNLILHSPLKSLGAPEIRSVDFGEMDLGNQKFLLPMPAFESDAQGLTAKEVFCVDTKAYETNAFGPKDFTPGVQQQVFGSEAFAYVKVNGLSYNPALNQLRYLKKITVFIPFGAALAQESASGSASLSQRQSNQLQLAQNSHAFKIKTLAEGYYRISFTDLAQAGFPVELNPQNFRMFYLGEEWPLYISGEGDHHFDSQDFLVFKAPMNEDRQAEAQNTFWLLADTTPGLRMVSVDATPNQQGVVENKFFETQTIEENREFFTKSRESETWFWKFLVAPSILDEGQFDFDLSQLATFSNESAVLTVKVHGVTDAGAAPDHHFHVYINNQLVSDRYFDGALSDEHSVTVPLAYLQNGPNQIRMKVIADLSGVPYDGIYVDRFSLSFPKAYVADNNRLDFTTRLYGNHDLSGFTAADIFVFDSTQSLPQLLSGFSITPASQGFQVRLKTPDHAFFAKFTALSTDQFLRVTSIEQNIASNYFSQEGDYLLLTAADFSQQAARLTHYRQTQGLTAQTIVASEVYDEFGFGIKSPSAIKNYLNYAQAHWSKKPRYVLLFGDGSFDPKNHMNLPSENFIPSPLVQTSELWTGSDVWYAQLNNDFFPEFAIGRLPVKTIQDATRVIDRILAYEALPYQESRWENTVSLVEDNVESPSDQQFAQTSMAIQNTLPGNFYVHHISEALSGGAASARAEIIDSINRGANFVNYVGHGSIQLWASETLFENQSVNQLRNSNDQLPIFVAMNCLNAYYFWPGIRSLSEEMVMADHGGAIAYWSSSGISQPHIQRLLNVAFFEALYPRQNANQNNLAQIAPIGTLGEAIFTASHALAGISNVESADVLKTWTLMGDPALQLKIPTQTQINANPGAPTLLANGAGATTAAVSVEESPFGCNQKGQRRTLDVFWLMLLLGSLLMGKNKPHSGPAHR